MSCSKPLPPFTYELLCFLNRDQLERFAIVCRPLKNFINRYFHSKPYRVFDRLRIRGGSYALCRNDVYWHPNREDYSVQQFLAGQKCIINESNNPETDQIYYSFAEMLPYLGPTIRIKTTCIFVGGDSTYNPDHIAEMESIAYLWRDHNIGIAKRDFSRIVAEDFQPILNSLTILQCQELQMINGHFSFKDYKILYAAKIIDMFYWGDYDFDPNYWADFLEQPGVKPIVGLHNLLRVNIDNTLDRLKEAFFSSVLPNAFKVVLVQNDEPLPEVREKNNTSREKLELKKGLPVEYLKDLQKHKKDYLQQGDKYTLERSSI